MEFRDLKRQYEYLKHGIDESIYAVIDESNYISGRQVAQLEEDLAEYVGVKNCITCANGTDALTLALMVWGVGKGDAVFVPDFTFFSSGECPAFVGATPIFVDVEPDTYNIDGRKLEEAILSVINEEKLVPRVVIAVDLFGQPANYCELKELCKKYNLYLLEDAAQGFGGAIGVERSCSFGDISITSFFPAKPLGCYGDGGALFTNNTEWSELIRSLAIHGKNGNDKYNNIYIGMNSRLDTIQAAILEEKFKAFKAHELNAVNEVANYYSELLRGMMIKMPKVNKEYTSSWAQYTIQLPEFVSREEIQIYLKDKDIPTMIYYKKPMHTQKAFSNILSKCQTECPTTVDLCNRVLSLPIHPYMTKKEVESVVDNLKKSLEKLQ